MRLVALDPGGTTGWATWDDDRGTIESGELTGDHHLELYNFLDFGNFDIIIYESFQYRRKEIDKGVAFVLDSVEYIGVIKLFVQDVKYNFLEPPDLIAQTPATGKGFWTNDKLKKVGAYKPGSEHEKDARRHLLQYMTFKLNRQEWLHKLR